MKINGPFAVLAGVMFVSMAAHAGELKTIFLPEDKEIELALEAGPMHLREHASAYVFGKDGYRQVRRGTNGFTCLINRDGNQNGDNDLKPTCWDAEGSRTIVPIVLRVGELIAKAASAEEIELDIGAGFASGRFSSPRRLGIAYMLRAELLFDPHTQQITKTAFVPHYMIYAPGLSNADIGMPAPNRDGSFSLPSIYSGYAGGPRTSYLIIAAAQSDTHTH